MAEPDTQKRRSLRYIRLAAFFAAQPRDTERITLNVAEIARLVDHDLPTEARQPSWWRNDRRRMHARAWITAGWQVESMDPVADQVVFVRWSENS